MNPRSLCAIALTLALPALGQTEPQLEPLVPPSLPPIAPLTPSRPLKTLGVLVLGALADETAVRVGDGIRVAAKLAPGVKEALALDAPHPCADKACWVTAGVARSVDQVVVATSAARTLKVRLVDGKARKVGQEANRPDVSSDAAEAAGWAEALVCKLLVPAGCTGEAVVQGGEGIALQLDGTPLSAGEKRRVPVGVHVLRVKEGSRESVRPLPVLVEGTPVVTIAAPEVASAKPPPASVVPIAPLVPPVTPPSAAPAAAVEAVPAAPSPSRGWPRPAGYAPGRGLRTRAARLRSHRCAGLLEHRRLDRSRLHRPERQGILRHRRIALVGLGKHQRPRRRRSHDCLPAGRRRERRLPAPGNCRLRKPIHLRA